MSHERPRWVKISVDGVVPVAARPRRFVEIPQQEQTSLAKVMGEYREAWQTNRLTPELVNRTWQTFWKDRLQAAGWGQALDVPGCDRTTQELSALRDEKRGIILLPEEVMSDMSFFFTLFPEAKKRSPLRNIFQGGGCVDVEMTAETPNREYNAHSITTRLKETERQGQRIQTYVVASVFHHLLTSEFFDQFVSGQTYALLLGSRYGTSRVLGATHWDQTIQFSEGSYDGSGFRTEGRKKS